MSEIKDIRAIAAGYDTVLVEAVGGEVLLSEAGAALRNVSVKMSKLAKEAKSNMKAAKKQAKSGNHDNALKMYDCALDNLNQLMEECKAIDDDNAVEIFLETFCKTFVPIFAGTLATIVTGFPAFEIAGIIIAYILGVKKVLNFSGAVERGITPANKQGVNGEYDATTWWKAGVNRADAMVRFQRMIDACEKGKAEIEKYNKK